MTTYRIAAEPKFVEDGPDAPMPGHHEAEFVDGEGHRILRYLTDLGRAEVLRTLAKGDRDLSEQEFADLTVEPDLDALADRAGIEGGVGG